MKILMISAEAVPFAKTGGLADAVTALSIALKKLGHDVRVVLPRYYKIDRSSLNLLDGPMGVPLGYGEEWTAVYTKEFSDIPFYFIDSEKYFGRDGIYGTKDEPDFADNPERFSLLCHGAFQLCHKLGWYPDIMHAHDWSAALVPVLLKFGKRYGEFSRTAGILSIHNLGYHGNYDKSHFPSFGLDWYCFHGAGFEDHDRINMLKAGLESSDALITVSPTYAQEIQTAEYGFRLDGILRNRNYDLYGILNGVDVDYWNPSKDTYIAKKYSVRTLKQKAVNKAALQDAMGLEVNPDIPLIGIVTRLADQKGVAEMFAPCFGSMYSICANMRVQVAVLGSGEKWCEEEIRVLQNKLPNFRAYLGYDETLSHQIEAGSDFFLMPSRYEPCGLNQMYSLLYGTLPIVRRTGGLADTVQQYNEATGEGTGFMFDYLSPQSVYDTVGWAVYAWYNKPEHIAEMKKRAMKMDFSWNSSAKQYEQVYQKILQRFV